MWFNNNMIKFIENMLRDERPGEGTGEIGWPFGVN